MENSGDIEKTSRSKLDSHEMRPPESAWSALDSELDKKQAILSAWKAKRFKMLSIALILLLCSSVSYYYLTPRENAVHISEVPGRQLPAAEVNPLPRNTNEKNGSQTRTSESPALLQSQKITSTGNKNETNYVSKNNNKNSKFFAAENAALENKTPGKNPGKNIKGENDENVIIPDDIKPITEEIAGTAPNSEGPGVMETQDTSGSAVDNIIALGKTDSSTSAGLLYIEAEDTKSRFSVALFYSPDYSFCKLKDNSSDNIDDAAMYNNRENSEFSFTTGVSLKYDLNDSWSLVSGITYSTRAKTITVNTMYAHADADHEMHFMYPTSSGMIEMPVDNAHPAVHEGDSLSARADCRLLIKFINVPLMVRVQAAKKKFTWYANGGFSVNFIVRQKARIKMDNSEMSIVNHVQGLNKMNYGFLLGAGVQYNIFNGMDLFTEPVFRGSFTSITHDTALNSYPYSLGLKTGILFRF